MAKGTPRHDQGRLPSGPGAGGDRDTLAMVAHGIDTVVHRHHAVQLVVGLGGPYATRIGERSFSAIDGFLVDSNVPHACTSGGRSVLVLSVDAASRRGEALRAQLGSKPFRLLHELVGPGRLAAFRAAYRRRGEGAPFDHLALVRQLTAPTRSLPPPDPRVARAVLLLSSAPPGPPFAAVAGQVGLSPRRLRHLFRAEQGLPMSGFLLWQRFKRAVALLAGGSDLAQAAAEAGFSDQAHLTRTFKRMFGVPPALLRERSDFLEVFG